MSYIVSLIIPDCPPDSESEDPTPLDAVESFIAQASQRDLWCYRVEEESGQHRVWIVDMASGPLITQLEGDELDV